MRDEITKKIKDIIDNFVTEASKSNLEACYWLLNNDEINLTPEQIAKIEAGLHQLITTNLDIATGTRLKALELYMANAKKF